MRLTIILSALALALLSPLLYAQDQVAHYRYKVIHTYPHDPTAFTEGLFYDRGYLYESTGEAGESEIRKVELSTGKVLQRKALDAQYFGEGIINWHQQLIQLTWKSGIGFVYDLASFKPIRSFNYQGEGWALTRNADHLIMSDGTDTLRLLDPTSLQVTGTLQVTENGQPVTQINELEWVKGSIYANIWQTNRIVRIDPHSGHVTADIDLGGLLPADTALPDPNDDVLNGIAYDSDHGRLFVTGKRWPQLYQIELVPANP